MSTGLSQELEDGLDFGDDEGEELTIEEAEEGAELHHLGAEDEVRMKLAQIKLARRRDLWKKRH